MIRFDTIPSRCIRRITHFYSRCTIPEAIQILAGRVISFRITSKSFLKLSSRESDELLTHCCCCWCHLLCHSQDGSLSPLICNHFQNDSTSSSPTTDRRAYYYDIFISPGLKWTKLNAVDLLIFRSIVHWETTTQRIKGMKKKKRMTKGENCTEFKLKSFDSWRAYRAQTKEFI